MHADQDTKHINIHTLLMVKIVLLNDAVIQSYCHTHNTREGENSIYLSEN